MSPTTDHMRCSVILLLLTLSTCGADIPTKLGFRYALTARIGERLPIAPSGCFWGCTVSLGSFSPFIFAAAIFAIGRGKNCVPPITSAARSARRYRHFQHQGLTTRRIWSFPGAGVWDLKFLGSAPDRVHP